MNMSASNATECGFTFAKEYYNTLATDPNKLLGMYTSRSEMVTETGETVVGQDEIAKVLQKKELEMRKFRLYSVGSHASVYESILVLVRGVVLTREASKNFSQSFVLARAHPTASGDNTYYIYNDVLELNDDVDVPQQQPQQAAPAQAAAQEYEEERFEEAPAPQQEEAPAAAPEEEEKEEEKEEEEAEPTPAPVAAQQEKPAAAAPAAEKTPPSKPVKETPPVVRSGWASVAATTPAKGQSAAPQKVHGGSIPGYKRPERVERPERGVSPTRGGRGTRGSSPTRFGKGFSIYVHLSGLKKEEISEKDVETIFNAFGPVTNKTMHVEKGFCFVDFADKKGMEAALAAEIKHAGKTLKCSPSGDKKKEAPKPEAKRGAAPGESKPRGLNGQQAAAAPSRKK